MSAPRGGFHALPTGPVEHAANRGATLRRLARELRPHRRTLAAALGFILVSALAQAAGPWLIGRAIDQAIARGDPRALARTMLLLLAVYAAGTLAARGQIRRVGEAGQRILADLRVRLFARLERLPLRYFAAHSVGQLMSRVVNDVDTLNQLLSGGLTQVVGALVSLVGILAAMLLLNVRLALASFVIIPVMLWTTRHFGVRARRAFRATRETVSDVTSGLEQEIIGIREAQAFGRTRENVVRFRVQNAANRDANVQAVAVTSAFAPAIDVLSTLATTLVIGYGSWLALHGEMTVGVVASFLIYVQQFFRPVQLASSVYTQAQSALAGAERIYAILDEAPEPADRAGAAVLGRVDGRIDFDHVDFAYDPGRPVLHDVSFTALPGQTVALVGETGAGKTTIASLLPRFYDVTTGAVLVDGHDVREVTRESLRAQISMVLQDPFMVAGTVADNIAYGRLDATREEIEAAARAVSAHPFIEELPRGYDTVLEEGGAISRGQRQLLAAARAVLADRPVLVLDEATSSVDSRTERLLQDGLRRLMAGRTSLVIAHRLSTIRNADLILVLSHGRIVERGTHDELMERGGAYAALHRRQFAAAGVGA
ncbi:MAG TPA: ABC transporter ATP-binding protein [Longimicrobiaceae bacterium]|nr:ABC transporter ATP-binding protein [Longimicrobiaceae bacterium]